MPGRTIPAPLRWATFRIPDLVEDATDWSRAPLRVDDIPPVQLASFITKMLHWFILRRHGLRVLKPFKFPDPPRHAIYRNGGWSPSDLQGPARRTGHLVEEATVRTHPEEKETDFHTSGVY